MSINSQNSPFWARPDPKEIAPGDIFPDIPFTISRFPTRVIRKYRENLPPKYAQNLHQSFVYPSETASIAPPVRLASPQGDETNTLTRYSAAMFLTYGSEVDADLRWIDEKGKSGGKIWLAAPVVLLSELPDTSPSSSKKGMRDIVQANESGHTFYLERFPSDGREHLGYYVEFRRICPVGVDFFLDRKVHRIATLMPASKNAMYHQLMWFWTRFELFFHPIACQACGSEVRLDVRLEGQNVDVDPWE